VFLYRSFYGRRLRYTGGVNSAKILSFLNISGQALPTANVVTTVYRHHMMIIVVLRLRGEDRFCVDRSAHHCSATYSAALFLSGRARARAVVLSLCLVSSQSCPARRLCSCIVFVNVMMRSLALSLSFYGYCYCYCRSYGNAR